MMKMKYFNLAVGIICISVGAIYGDMFSLVLGIINIGMYFLLDWQDKNNG